MGLIHLCLTLLHLLSLSSSLSPDGALLLSFKYSIISDPLSVLDNWDYSDPTPCSWAGVTCGSSVGSPDSTQVVSLVLPHSKLVGSIPEDIGFIIHLHTLDLSDNSFNGPLPASLFNHTKLQTLALSNNNLSGEIPEITAGGVSLQVLDLSNNALAGKLPENLPNSKDLTVISLKNNHISGLIPTGFNLVEILDLSSNSLNGSLPIEFGGERLKLLNLSKNSLSGSVSSKFASKIPTNASIDLSSNNLSGEIPPELNNRKPDAFANNLDLCGNPLKKICTIASSISVPPNITSSTPAIAAIPRSLGPSSDDTDINNNNSTQNPQIGGRKGVNSKTVTGIVVGDLVGIGILGVIFMYVYRLRREKNRRVKTEEVIVVKKRDDKEKSCGEWGCIGAKGGDASEEGISSSSNGSDNDENGKATVALEERETEHGKQGRENKSLLVMVDGETKLDMETLLKASAYILGSSGSKIVYKAVLQDGTAFAVRRIGESSVERLRNFECHVRTLAKLRHPNVVRVRGFYWGDDEKLIIYDYISNGSLAISPGYKRASSTSTHFSFEIRLKIARGLARGLSYIHEKKQVHGNIKPSNILLTEDMNAVVSDLGLDRLLSPDSHVSSILYPSLPSLVGRTSAYHAPESLENAKPSQKSDVYSFGIVFLELLTGRVFSDRELGQWTTGLVAEDMCQLMKMADAEIKADVVGRMDTLLACFKLGLNCTSSAPHKRPSMKEVLQVIDKMPC